MKSRKITDRATAKLLKDLEFKFSHYKFFPISAVDYTAHMDLIENMAVEKGFVKTHEGESVGEV